MTEIVNLNRARKALAKKTAKAAAAENRVAFGRSNAEKSAGKTATGDALRKLEAHRRAP